MLMSFDIVPHHTCTGQFGV